MPGLRLYEAKTQSEQSATLNRRWHQRIVMRLAKPQRMSARPVKQEA